MAQGSPYVSNFNISISLNDLKGVKNPPGVVEDTSFLA